MMKKKGICTDGRMVASFILFTVRFGTKEPRTK
jgi:hypothetical protein